MLAHGFLREGVDGARKNALGLRCEGSGAILQLAFIEMQAEISPSEIRQDRMTAGLSPAGLPAALEFQVGEGVTSAVRFLPNAARETGDQFRVRAIAEFLDRFAFCYREFHAEIKLAENRE